MAIDTTRVRWSGVEVSPAILEAINERETVSDFSYHERSPVPGQRPWRAAMWKEAGLGVMGLVDRPSGSAVWVECSLGKMLNGDNQKLLCREEVLDGYATLLAHVETEFRPIFYGDTPLRERAECSRVDGYYQQPVDSSAAVITALAQALGNRSKINQYASSLDLKQSREQMGRWYDKGLESGNEQLLNVLRHEEQIRPANRAAYYVNATNGTVNFEALRHHMNKRYEGWPEAGIEVPDVASLVREHGRVGLEVAGLILCPSLESVAYQHMARGTFYKRRKLMQEYSRKTVQVDLRVPEDAWNS